MSIFADIFATTCRNTVGQQQMSNVAWQQALAPVISYGTANYLRGHGQRKPHLYYMQIGGWQCYFQGARGRGESFAEAYSAMGCSLQNRPWGGT